MPNPATLRPLLGATAVPNLSLSRVLVYWPEEEGARGLEVGAELDRAVSAGAAAEAGGAASAARAGDELVAGNQRDLQRHALGEVEGVLGIAAEALAVVAGVAVGLHRRPDEELIAQPRPEP